MLFSENAERELDEMDKALRAMFIKHVEKLQEMPPRRHLKFGMPYNVEDVTKQARMVYTMKDDTLYILRCFNSHKEYEAWYKSFM